MQKFPDSPSNPNLLPRSGCDPWTVVHQAPLSMGFSRQQYWSGLPFPSPVSPLKTEAVLFVFTF